MRYSTSTFAYGIVAIGSFLLLNYVVLYYNVILKNLSITSLREKRIFSDFLFDKPTLPNMVSDFIIDEPGSLRNPEWEQLNKDEFYRRSMAYYFVEKSLLRVYSLSRNPWHRDFDNRSAIFQIKLVIQQSNGERYLIKLNNVTCLYHDNRYEYDLASLNANLSLVEMLNEKFGLNLPLNNSVVESLRIKLFVQDMVRNITTKHSMDVKTRIQSKPKYGSMLCTYCYFYGESETFDNHIMFLYWIELNKKFGYQKIGICNHSFPATKEYKELFEKHKDLVHMYQLKTCPNVNMQQKLAKDEKNEYYTSFNQVSSELTVPLEVLMYNECYMDNIDKFKRVSINGADELIIPRSIEKISTDKSVVNLIANLDLRKVKDKKTLHTLLDLENSCKTTEPAIENYLNSLENKFKQPQPMNFHFGMGHYLRDFSIDIIMAAIETYFNSSVYKPSEKRHTFSVVDTSYENYTYTFVLNGDYEVNYIRNLAKVYRLLIGDFKREKKEVISKHLNQFNRFLFFAGNLTWHLCGKSIYNTEKVMAVSVHYPDRFESEGITTFGWDQGVGLDSHFRHQYSLRVSNITFDELKIDLNYFYCYYRDVVKELLNVDPVLD